MADSGATATALPPAIMATSHSSLSNFHHHHDDPLTLNEYGLPELRSSLHSPTAPAIAAAAAAAASPSQTMPSFSDYPSMAFGQSQHFTSPFENGPTIKTNLNDHRGSISNLSDENVSADSANPHRLSIGSPGNYGQDGNNTSPESAPALGMLAIGDQGNDASAYAMRLDDSINGDTADGSATSKKDKDQSLDPPAWSEMKTKAGKERKRLPLACIACRRKKIRCSGEKPACKHCLRSRIPCVYKVTTRKAAPRTDYMAMLDKRLKRMEDRVIKLIPKESLPSVSGVGRSVVKPALPGAPLKTPTTKKRPAEEAFGNDLDEWSKTKSANPDAAGSASRAKDSDESSLLTEGLESLPPRGT